MVYESLFEPIKIRDLEMDNRVVFPAITTKMSDKYGFVEKNLIDYHVERVKGGTGLNILEATSVHKDSMPENFLSIADDIYIAKLKKLVEEIHSKDGKIGIQLWQSGMYDMDDLERDIIAPSDYTTENGREIKESSVETIEEIIESFGKAAKRAMEAGFDVIEINVGHSNLLHTFLSSAYNKRIDKYGGSLENRSRLLMEVIKSIRKNISEGTPLFMKIISKDDNLEDGLTTDDIIKVINKSEELGVDLVTISRGNQTTNAIKYEVPSLDIPMDYNLENIKKIKKNTNILISGEGRIISPKYADEYLKKGYMDLVSIGRGQLADPYFVNKSKNNNEEDIIKCIGCNQGCYDGFFDPLFQYISCLRNPAIGFEEKYKVGKTESPQKVAVVGGGIGGMLSSLILNRRGHEPVLFEKNNHLGGQFKLLGTNPSKIEIKKFMDRTIEDVENLNIEKRMGEKFEDQMVVDEEFDSVIIATGSDPKILNVKGSKKKNVVDYVQVLDGQINLDGRVAIIGANSIGLEVAEFLYLNKLDILLLEEGKEIGSDLGHLRRLSVKDIIAEHDIDLRFNVDFEEIIINDNSVEFEQNGKKIKENIDYVVMAVGAESNKSNYIKQYCQDREIPFYVVGDALIPRKALDAIAEAYNISLFEIE